MAGATSGEIELVDFWAAWCGPCKKMEPMVEEIAQEYQSRVKITKVDADDEASRPLLEQFNIMSIPTYLFKKEGAVVASLVGIQSKETMTKKLDALLEG